jgi:hypothetical protein
MGQSYRFQSEAPDLLLTVEVMYGMCTAREGEPAPRRTEKDAGANYKIYMGLLGQR